MANLPDNAAFSPQQMQQLEAAVQHAVRQAMADSGLRLETDEQQDEARADFRFIRSMRKGVNGLASKIGWAIILAFLGGLIFIFTQGLSFWNRGSP